MTKPKILHIAPWASGRVYKQIITQQLAGWDVTMMYGLTGHKDLLGMVEKYRGWGSPKDIQSMTGFDVVVLHTTCATFNHAKDLPLPKANWYVWDCHDYMGKDGQDRFDKIVCPSVGMTNHLDNSTTIYSKVPRMMAPIQASDRLDAVILAATIGNGEKWADYAGLSDRLKKPVFIFPSSDKYHGHHLDMVMQNVNYPTLMNHMTKFKYGYAGAANPETTVHDCVTNKFWEYLAAGCKVLTYNSDEMTGLLLTSEVEGDKIYMESELSKMTEAYGL